MPRLLTSLSLSACLAAAALAGACAASNEGVAGYWSPQARKPYDAHADRYSPVASSDGSREIVLDPEHLTLVGAGRKTDVPTLFSPATVEVLWAPDGQAVAITGSDGGASGTWSVKVLDGQGRDRSAKVQAAALRLNKGLAKCDEPEDLNVTAAGWAGSRLLVRIEVPPHSSCANMGTARFAAIDGRNWDRGVAVTRSQAEKLLGRPLR